MRFLSVALIIVVLSLLLAATAYASYTGVGIINTGSPSVRAGSTNGVGVVGGGPGSGK